MACNQRQPWYAWALLILFLAAAAWCTRDWLSPNFGLYEDDLTFIPSAVEADFKSVLSMISGYFSTLAEQGRPFMWSFVVLFGHLGWRLGGLQGMYLIAYGIWLINILLFLLLLRRIQWSFLFCAVGGLAYVVFSADTTQSFLFNAFGLQTAITFFLAALHLYIGEGKLRWLAYVFLALVMLTYETPFLLFFAAPLLTKHNGKTLKKKLVANTILVALIFLAIYFLRLAAGESRAASLGFPEIILTPLKHMAIGPLVGLGSYFLRPIQVMSNITLGLGLAALLASVFVLVVLAFAREREECETVKLLPIRKGWWTDLSPEARQEVRILLAGLVMLVLAYPLTVILRPYAISGRATRVHLAAVLGASLVFASLAVLILRAFHQKASALGLIILVSIILGGNFAFGFIIQGDFARAWQLQQDFWKELLPLIQDVRKGTAVLVEPGGLEDPLYINANTWNLPRMLPQMFVFPEAWDQVPQVFRLVPGWEDNIVRVPRYFTLDGSNVFANNRVFGDFEQRNTIFISNAQGEFARLLEFNLNGEVITVKPQGDVRLAAFETRWLYHLLIEDR